ncbi:TerB family tellurite resistance protein [Aestuariispira insulae]|uniref:Putative tellurite resistance protein B-like protein n=1 Tax=Aestuariispira insulae TaxID=1461337 RepID=A0A3D9HER2_9PROT|nr:TerB family tellurite resistance protein [Aestuariispira insulae]RED47731.1 putative tellurite resistance protein B-like protein [Aestuariispira insulae]
MWSKVRDFLFEKAGEPEPDRNKHTLDELHIAAAALMVEAAMLDGNFDEQEKSAIVHVCKRHFNIDCDTARKLVEEAQKQQKDAVDIHNFISKFAPHFDHAERLKIMEMMWEVVYADGELHSYEANLMRRVCGLLGVKDQENGDLRKQVLARIEAGNNSLQTASV